MKSSVYSKVSGVPLAFIPNRSSNILYMQVLYLFLTQPAYIMYHLDVSVFYSLFYGGKLTYQNEVINLVFVLCFQLFDIFCILHNCMHALLTPSSGCCCVTCVAV